MPDTVLPSSIGTELNDILRRLTALETGRPSAMTLLGEVYLPNESVAYPLGTTFFGLAETIVSFTLTRPTPILFNAALLFFTSGGTASYGIVQGQISTTNINGFNAPTTDLNGRTCTTLEGQHTNSSGLSNFYGGNTYVLPAGTFYASIHYKMDAGATTTLTDFGCQVLVWQLAG
jgi:hypothetical protein